MKKIFTLFLALVCATVAFAQKKVFTMADYAEAIGTTYINSQATYGEGENAITLIPGQGGQWKMQSDVILLFGKLDTKLQLPALPFAVAKIVVNGPESGASGKVTFNIFDGETAISEEVTGANGTHTFMIDAAHQAAGTIYSIKNTNANNNQVVSIEIYEAVAGAPEAPVFSVAGGTFTEAQNVELTCATEGVEIRYTVDGTEPTAESTLYTAPITITETTTVSAVAVKGGVCSTVVSATYQIITTQGQGTEESPYTVSDVVMLNNNGANAWVVGTICGVYANNEATDDAEAISKTPSNIALTDGEKVIPVQLPAGDVRAALNLVDNPGNLGATVKIKGDLVAYFSTTGLKNAKEFVLDATGIKSVSANNNNEIYNLAGQRVAKAQKGLYIIGGKKVVK